MTQETRDRLRILHVAQPTSGGVAAVVSYLARAQRADGNEVTVACPRDGSLAAALEAAGVRVATWPASRSPGTGLAAETRGLSRILAREAPDLVHLHSSKAGLAGRLAVRGRVPTVFQPHAWSFEAVDGALRAASLGWERYAVRWTDRVVCVSARERAVGAEAGIRAGFTVVPNGVDTRWFQPAQRAAARAVPPVAALGARAGDPLVVAVGRLCRQKGQDVLLEAWRRVLERCGAARLALVGDGPDAALHARTVGGDPRLRGVHLAGHSDDPRPWYHAADLVVLPSRWEAMALVPIEASACGRLVLASDVAGVRESLPQDRCAWSVVPPGDSRALAEALARALEQLARDPAGWARAQDRAARHARARHDVARTAQAVSEVYLDVLRGRPPAGGGRPSHSSMGPETPARRGGGAVADGPPERGISARYSCAGTC